ncbi:MAG TPA: FAD-dependent oxidoreductase [Kofleriaceae bacterium]|nr:FAD-dependent oxidoreductase [Kofleriaceae bacterium]
MLLGGPIAAQLACRSRGRSLPPGRLIETGMTRGHALVRDGAVPAPTRTRELGVAIIGGGVAGLACAWELKRRGIASTILELDDAIGGTARGGGSEVTPYPWGAHYIVAPQSNDEALVPLLAEMNAIEGYAADGSPIIDEALRCREPEERVWYAGRWWEGLYLDAGASADDRRQLDAFKKLIDGWSAWRDDSGRRAFAIPRSAATDDPRVTSLDQISFAQWLDQHHLTSPRLRWLCDYGCRDDYALTAATTSAWAGIFYFAARQKAPGSASQTVITWPNGNAALVAQLAKSASIETGVTVIDVDDRTTTITAIDRDGPIAIHARAIVVATPAFVANRIVRSRRGQPHGDYGAWVVANVHLRGRPIERGRGCPPAWDNVFRDSPSLGYVSATHQRGRDRGPTVWTWYYAFADDDAAAVRKKLAGAGYAEWADVIVADLERAHPDVRDHVETIDVAFWGHGMIRPRVGSAWSPALAARRERVGSISFAHTDLSGLALFEEAFDHGLRAAREVAT